VRYYPTIEHEAAAGAVVEHLSAWPEVEAVVLVGSCARGRAAPTSCLDILVLAEPEVLARERPRLEQAWQHLYGRERVFAQLRALAQFSHVDLEFADGDPKPIVRDWWCGDPDSFELEIGNTFIYTVPLYERGDYFRRMRDRWLPFYDDALRRERLAMVRKFCANNLDHIPLFVDRGLHFQAFKRLYDASREFLQALFIARRVYPIAYDKWIREQLVDMLHLPDVYREMVALFEYDEFESDAHIAKAEAIHRLLNEHAKE
jgi:predicted nucleotidyltransferase